MISRELKNVKKKSYRVSVQSLQSIWCVTVIDRSCVFLRCSRASDEWMELAITVLRSLNPTVMGTFTWPCVVLRFFYVFDDELKLSPSRRFSHWKMLSLSFPLSFVRLNRDRGDSKLRHHPLCTTRSASSFPSSFSRIDRLLSTRLPFCAARGDNDDDRSIYRLLRIFLRIRAFQRLARPSGDLMWR